MADAEREDLPGRLEERGRGRTKEEDENDDFADGPPAEPEGEEGCRQIPEQSRRAEDDLLPVRKGTDLHTPAATRRGRHRGTEAGTGPSTPLSPATRFAFDVLPHDPIVASGKGCSALEEARRSDRSEARRPQA
jgi:hypothetical protein